VTPLRILFVTSGLKRGGAEGFLVRLATRLVARGHVCGVASFGSRAPLVPALVAGGVLVHELGGGAILPLAGLNAFARRFRPDVVQGWMYRGNLGALAAAWGVRPKPAVVWSVRQGLNDLHLSRRRTRYAVAANGRLSRCPFAIVYNAESARQKHIAAGFAADKSRVIVNGIDAHDRAEGDASRSSAREKLRLAEADFVVTLLARWHPVKNHRGFVRAAGLFARQRPGARFLLAGKGIDSENRTLSSWLQEERIGDRASLLGERTDVQGLLLATDVATLASIGEALPNVLLEAMALGVPCVAPDVGDIADLVGTTGVVVPAGDDAALAAGWERLAAMTDPDRRALGERARARVVEFYGLDRAVAAFEALFAEAAGA
jgi:glycosyltransferase involved in cell wall biosynthesis